MSVSGGRDRLTPVFLLTGFLGSGKTTLLQRIVVDPAFAGAAVLINEFGEVGLDHHLLERIDETTVLMKSGCVCCTVRGELAEALVDLDARRASGAIPAFDRVIIETSGLADPYPALSTLRAHPVLVHHFRLGATVTTVDAVNGGRLLGERLEAVRQVAAADILVLTKTDVCGEREAAALVESLAALNPTAPPRVGAEGIAEAMASTESRQRGWAVTCAPLSHHAESGVRTLCLTVNEGIDWTAFGLWLSMLLNRHGERIYRVKGILNVEGEPRPVALHGVGRLVHPPIHLSAWPDQERASRLVFIFEGLEPAAIERSFDIFVRRRRTSRVDRSAAEAVA